jgi:hypothetical protein
MVEQRAALAPTTAEERQAMATVTATREVYGEIQALAEILRETWRPQPQRVDAKHALLHASERLCNLMSLALYQLENNTSGALRERLTAELDDLKNRLMSMSARLMVEKLEKIDKRAEEVLRERDYPIGLAGKLDIAFANLMSNLKVLGGPERLGDRVPELVAKTETDIQSLTEIEKKLGVMVDVPNVKKRR